MRINGFEQIKAFYSWSFSNQELGVKPQHISLYLFLINQNNRNNWVEWFKVPFDLGMAGSCISSKKTYYDCLSDLQDWGLIKYEKGINNWKAPLVRVEVLKDTATVPQSEPQPIPLPVPQVLPQPIPQHILLLLQAAIPQPIPNIKLLTSNFKLITGNIKQVVEFLDGKNEPEKKEPVEAEKKTEKKIADASQSVSVFNQVKKEFLIFYKENFNEEYYFSAMDGKKIKDLLKKVKFKIVARTNTEPSEKDLADSTMFFISEAKKNASEWLLSNFKLANLDSQFNELFIQIKNNANGRNSTHSARNSAANSNGLTPAQRAYNLYKGTDK